jgi:Mn2+/Fe2+ NRAMP family transporter
LYAIFFGVASLLLQVYVPCRIYVRYLKWLTWALFAYVLTAFVVRAPWGQALRSTLVPCVSLDPKYLMALIAVLGTTISPFWQTAQEVEDARINKHESPLRKKPLQAWAQFRRIAFDTRVGMAFSNIVAFFIILTTAATLHASNASIRIQTAADAAKALQPLAGRFASLLFAPGIIGTGMLAIPVLAGSAAYAVSELFGWRASLESKPGKARKFYYVLSGATILGVCLNFAGIDPIRALFLSAGVNGIVAVPLMFSLMLISEKPAIVGKFVLPRYLRVAGWIATAVMLVASLGFPVTALPQWLAR